jgi:hypothetical protein
MTSSLIKIDVDECKWIDIDIDIDTELLYCYEVLDEEDIEDEILIIPDLEDICEPMAYM